MQTHRLQSLYHILVEHRQRCYYLFICQSACFNFFQKQRRLAEITEFKYSQKCVIVSETQKVRRILHTNGTDKNAKRDVHKNSPSAKGQRASVIYGPSGQRFRKKKADNAKPKQNWVGIAPLFVKKRTNLKVDLIAMTTLQEEVAKQQRSIYPTCLMTSKPSSMLKVKRYIIPKN